MASNIRWNTPLQGDRLVRAARAWACARACAWTSAWACVRAHASTYGCGHAYRCAHRGRRRYRQVANIPSNVLSNILSNIRRHRVLMSGVVTSRRTPQCMHMCVHMYFRTSAHTHMQTSVRMSAHMRYESIHVSGVRVSLCTCCAHVVHTPVRCVHALRACPTRISVRSFSAGKLPQPSSMVRFSRCCGPFLRAVVAAHGLWPKWNSYMTPLCPRVAPTPATGGLFYWRVTCGEKRARFAAQRWFGRCAMWPLNILSNRPPLGLYVLCEVHSPFVYRIQGP